jgi:ketosteroid isomerase-like protein
MADAEQEAEQEIKQLAHEWLDAARRRDQATLDRILADDFVISGWQPDGRLADKQFYIEDCMRPVDIQDGSIRFDRWQFRIYGETAVVNCILDIRAVVNGHPWGAEVLITDVWVKQRDAWRVVTRHTSPIVRARSEKGSRD